MEKYGVSEDTSAKLASEHEHKCPKCGSSLEVHGSVWLCPRCGSEPFEPGTARGTSGGGARTSDDADKK